MKSLDRTAQLIDLLSVCEHSARHVADLHEEFVPAAASSLARTLGTAIEMAEEIHGDLDKAELKAAAS